MAQVIDWTRFGKRFNETRTFAVCYNCANRKHGNWICQSNMVYELNYEENKCKSFVSRVPRDAKGITSGKCQKCHECQDVGGN